VAAKFESIFLGFLIKQMWESVERSGLLEESSGRKIHDGMMVDMLSDHLAQNGGIGLAKSMVSRLKAAAEAYEEQQTTANALEVSRRLEDANSGQGDTHPLAGEVITKH
jgi:Rod binding domain-containing protein